MERKEFIQKLVMEQKSRHEVHGALISEGYSTAGYEDEYASLLAERGAVEPVSKPNPPLTNSIGENLPHASAPDRSLPTVGSMLTYGFSLAKKKWKSVVFASVLIVAANSGFIFLPDLGDSSVGVLAALVLGVISVYISFLASGALLYVLIRSEEVSYLEGLQWSFQRFLSILWLSILAMLVTMGGLVLLVIPALVFGVYTIFSYIVLVREDARGMRALLRSTDLVRGKFWEIALKTSVIVIVCFFIGIVLGALSGFLAVSPELELVSFVLLSFGQMLITAVCLGAFVKLYEARVQANPLFDLHAYSSLKWIYRAMAVLGILLPFIFVVLAGGIFYAMFNTFNSFDTRDTKDAEEQIEWGVQESEVEDSGNFNFSDLLQQTKVETTAASANVSGGRMGSYEGACNDIIVVAPIECVDTAASFAVFAPMSNGTYYCVDSEEFSGAVPRPSGALCN